MHINTTSLLHIFSMWEYNFNIISLREDIRDAEYNIHIYIGWCYDVYRHFQQYLSYIVAVSFIDGGTWSTRRKPPTCRKSLTNFITLCCVEYLRFERLFIIDYYNVLSIWKCYEKDWQTIKWQKIDRQ